jgi:hypothetical protein
MGQLVVVVLLFARALVVMSFGVMPRRGGTRLGHIGGINRDGVISFPKLCRYCRLRDWHRCCCCCVRGRKGDNGGTDGNWRGDSGVDDGLLRRREHNRMRGASAARRRCDPSEAAVAAATAARAVKLLLLLRPPPSRPATGVLVLVRQPVVSLVWT